jgi:hypothetical protein
MQFQVMHKWLLAKIESRLIIKICKTMKNKVKTSYPGLSYMVTRLNENGNGKDKG